MQIFVRMCFYVLALFIFLSSGFAQVSYNDVAVIVNLNSNDSKLIGNYFQVKRNIPNVNMIYISTSTSEEITSTEFDSLRSQVESYILLNNLRDSINYIVTTKGVPLKINRGGFDIPIGQYRNECPSASVESELSCILGYYSKYIGQAGIYYSPYYYKFDTFSKKKYDMYLVTRLDGYSTDDVFKMIDRSGPNTLVSKSALYIFDQDTAWSYALQYINDNMKTAADSLLFYNKNVELNTDTIYVTYRSSVIGYMSWGSNDHYAYLFTEHGIPHNTWSVGSIADMYVSTSGRSFNYPPVYGQSLISELIKEGVCGAKGYVYEPMSSAMTNPIVLFGKYLHGYNLAESFHSSFRYMSWVDVVVGDPKTTIINDPLPVTLVLFIANWNNDDSIKLQWKTISEINNYGYYVQKNMDSVWINIGNLIPAIPGSQIIERNYEYIDYIKPFTKYRLLQIDLDGTKNYSNVISIITSVNDSIINTFNLYQNYPNPFNSSTVIRYSIEKQSNVKIVVYNELGQEIFILVDKNSAPGNYSVNFPPVAITSGTYYYRIYTDGHVETKKMICIK